VELFKKEIHITNNKQKFFRPKYVLYLLLLLILCIMDGTLTILLINMGAWEANPVMRHALSISREFFLVSKYVLTSAGLLFLLINGERKVFGGRCSLEEIAGLFIIFYEGLIIYEITLYMLLK